MPDRYIVTRRKEGRSLSGAEVNDELRASRVSVVQALESGVVAEMGSRKAAALQQAGYRVKRLANQNRLRIGGHEIDVTLPEPTVPRPLDIPRAGGGAWQHHALQFVAPAQTDWIESIEDRGLEIVEPLPPYGLYVRGDRETAAALSALPFVRWVGPIKPAYRVAPRLAGMRGRIKHVEVTAFADGAVEEVRQTIADRGTIVSEREDSRGALVTILTELPSRAIPMLARHPDVKYLEYVPESVLLDERSCQIAFEDLDGVAPPNTGPNVGYQANLAALGVDGTGVTIAICDSGVGSHNNTTMQADLAGRMAFFADQTGGATTTDVNGHGTHVAGIAVGNAASGDTDPGGFLLGQGVAPASQFGSINAIAGGVPINLPTWTQTAVTNASNVMNNSWGTAQGGVPLSNQGYTGLCQSLDQLVRDPDNNTAALESLIIVWAAGNSGSALSTMGEPAEAKNAIVVGNSLNRRPGEGDVADDIRGLRTSSSRGPAVDGRILPTVLAPGTDIISARPTVDANPAVPGVQRPRNAYTDTGGAVHQNHFSNSGTSMAAPHVAGICALLAEWWRNRTGGKDPSPAFVKALLVNGAEDAAGGPDRRGGNIGTIPNNDQGWGRVSIENMLLQAPASDRGPKLFLDQRHAFTGNNQEYLIRVAAADNTRPLRITLTWSDAAGAANANPALVNDLDLEVTELATGNIFRGNVFNNGFSVTGGNFDALNNVECVYVPNPQGTYEVTVIASSIAASARPDIATPWQDFALVIDNGEVPSADPVAVVPVIDRSGSMQIYGYVDVTRTASKQFVDLMGIDDELGVVSFGSTGTVEYPSGPGPSLETIVDQTVRDAASAEIDGINFGGCTFMGDGIVKARDLLAGSTNARAMVLLSDGFDNKGCDQGNPARLSAVDAAATLPADVPIYTCAMGPTSDQDLLAQLAEDTNGLYYYMPTIDDLFEIYNYIRGQVTGEGIIVNDSNTASHSRLAGFVDSCARSVTFSAAWANKKIRYVSRGPRRANEVSVRLRDPRGRLLHPNATEVRRRVGDGYVVFQIEEPLPGRWYVEVETAANTHTRYTVGGFVNSQISLELYAVARRGAVGMPIRLVAQVVEGGRPIDGTKAHATTSVLATPIEDLLRKHRRQLDRVRIPRVGGRDVRVIPALAKLVLLRNAQIAKGGSDLFATRTITAALTRRTQRFANANGLASLMRRPDAASVAVGTSSTGGAAGTVVTNPLRGTIGGTVVRPVVGVSPGVSRVGPGVVTIRPPGSGLLVGAIKDTKSPGTYNVVVTATGFAPSCGSRFVRSDLVSVLVSQG